ncbi:MAG TPA: PIN domain-containing protein [Candidatus Acidoferrales bacterium]|nr:PIN domain-containing protein [Candidatus Acidoferrales bacterium]
MSGEFVNTNILLYAHDSNAGPKHERAVDLVQRLWNSGEGILSTQVLQEFAFNLSRKSRPALSIEEVRLRVLLYSQWSVVANTPATVVRAIDLQSQFGISFWDALIVGAASTSGADILYSEDLSDGNVYGSVRVVNPFK